MFFSISKEEKQNFPNHYRLGNFVINTDNGWTLHNSDSWTAVVKGYADHSQLSLLLDDIVNQVTPKFTGNFCAIVYNKQHNNLKIQTDLYRSFPIFYSLNNEVTNLTKLSNTVYTDNVILITESLDVEYPLKSNFNIIGDIDTSSLTVDQAVERIDNILSTKTQQFLRHNTLPVKVHLSGGVDSLLVYSYIRKYTDNYEMVKCQHIDYDYFCLLNYDKIASNWGYKQIHHWRESCILTSGAPGDEFMLRSPTTCDLFLKYYNIDIVQLTKENPDCLHHEYFLLNKHLDIFNSQQIDKSLTKEQMYEHLCDIIINDWQHWHLGNTLTWTPLRDLEIFKLLLRLPPELATGQILNSDISRLLIEKNFPGGTKLISDKKNNNLQMKNLIEFLGFNE